MTTKSSSLKPLPATIEDDNAAIEDDIQLQFVAFQTYFIFSDIV